MKYRMILNAFKGDIQKQLEEVTYFISGLQQDIQIDSAFIIGGDEMDGNDKEMLAEMVPTSSVIFVYMETYCSELLLDYLETVIDKDEICIFSAGYLGLEIAPRLAYRLKGSVLIDCEKLYKEDGVLIGEKKFYAGHMMGSYQLTEFPVMLCLSKGQNTMAVESTIKAKVTEVVLEEKSLTFSNSQAFPSVIEDDFSKSDFALVVGRGVKSQGAVSRLQELGEKLGASFGASRPVVMNGWLPMERLVGASGAILAPKITIVAGASGAPALYSGIEKSDFIVAINKDEKAPIMKKADVAVVGDATEVITEMVRVMGGEDAVDE
ncbi:electron transfer flavoprotein subunit alpha/FixB family protein [Ohessyouella blattaphilus]|uniref:Electron transfer flavoprotein subunit alpha/FixB family protein n=1 Tax=Ohessyouella blattaphilus TaxID=2949333 RepID=A0ABT1EGG7_9FIRM|nr:electron transfer flavoprotein subunit alpha/FixB family protein [Ohessyouella blattaphilus]MCP1109792.1 electron transfer flavoprotein subunit alpha/FixB family protein [Ohessyouella blattaphilus]MCR8563186.1 electron transfer flavoprotein subunit alpha/FixB family protein [Ohessyouella blattaphilus]